MSIRGLSCPKCGVPITLDGNTCGYRKAQYVVVGNSNAFPFGEYVECRIFKTMQGNIKKIESLNDGYVGDTPDAKRIEELIDGKACRLIEAGFEFICDCEGNKVFRKQK